MKREEFEEKLDDMIDSARRSGEDGYTSSDTANGYKAALLAEFDRMESTISRMQAENDKARQIINWHADVYREPALRDVVGVRLEFCVRQMRHPDFMTIANEILLDATVRLVKEGTGR